MIKIYYGLIVLVHRLSQNKNHSIKDHFAPDCLNPGTVLRFTCGDCILQTKCQCHFLKFSNNNTVRKSWLYNKMGPRFYWGPGICAGRIRGAHALPPPLFSDQSQVWDFFASHAIVQPHTSVQRSMDPQPLPTCFQGMNFCTIGLQDTISSGFANIG